MLGGPLITKGEAISKDFEPLERLKPVHTPRGKAPGPFQSAFLLGNPQGIVRVLAGTALWTPPFYPPESKGYHSPTQ